MSFLARKQSNKPMLTTEKKKQKTKTHIIKINPSSRILIFAR